MSTTTLQVPLAPTMLDRSKKWLARNPSLSELKQAIRAIVSQIQKGDLANDEDTRDTYDALTEQYVDHGGDLTELSLLPDADELQSAGEIPVVPVSPAGLDYGSLYPADAPVVPLSKEEKRNRLEAIRASLTRPGGF